ncbi:MAG: hypothetical protein HQK91_02825 [Nitrospirae bacterium]|nr:hypothetical protein [Nitrospirota bacterium]
MKSLIILLSACLIIPMSVSAQETKVNIDQKGTSVNINQKKSGGSSVSIKGGKININTSDNDDDDDDDTDTNVKVNTGKNKTQSTIKNIKKTDKQKEGEADVTGYYIIEVTGNAEYTGEITYRDKKSNTVKKAVEGKAPKTYTIDSKTMTCYLRNKNKTGSLKVTVKDKDGNTNVTSTSEPYGTVQLSLSN